MTITVEKFTGTETIGATEWGMTADTTGVGANTTAGIHQAFIDVNAMAAGDVFEFKVYEKCRTGDTQRLVYYARFADAPATPIWVSPTLILGIGWDMTLKKITGTDRVINWRISSVT